MHGQRTWRLLACSDAGFAICPGRHLHKTPVAFRGNTAKGGLGTVKLASILFSSKSHCQTGLQWPRLCGPLPGMGQSRGGKLQPMGPAPIFIDSFIGDIALSCTYIMSTTAFTHSDQVEQGQKPGACQTEGVYSLVRNRRSLPRGWQQDWYLYPISSTPPVPASASPSASDAADVEAWDALTAQERQTWPSFSSSVQCGHWRGQIHPWVYLGGSWGARHFKQDIWRRGGIPGRASCGPWADPWGSWPRHSNSDGWVIWSGEEFYPQLKDVTTSLIGRDPEAKRRVLHGLFQPHVRDTTPPHFQC